MDGGFETKTAVAYGRTYCNQWEFTDAARIEPGDYWLAASENFKDYYLTFNDETKRSYLGGRLLYIIQNTTVINPVTLKNKPYDCIILDERIQHFGVDFYGKEPA